ncbi:MAG: ABC transporter permease, partial [Anaerolineaceae bacterium]|nr:ABC transporter permease [Anaerolineaceae bacterium]
MNKTNRELQHIIQLAKTGKLNEARLMLRTRLEHNPLDERAWYLLALFAASNQKKFLYYQQCLKTNPNNQRAIDKLQTLLDFKENEFQKQSFEKSPLLHNDLSASGEKKQQKPSTQLDPQKEEKIDPEKINSKKHPTFFRVLRYLLLRILTIFLTIFLGIFLTVMIVNRTGQIDQNVETEISNFVNRIAWSDEWAEMTSEEKAIARETMIAEKTEAIGLNLPFLPRHLRWTLRSMTFEWGELNYSNFASRFPVSDQSDMILDLILKAFPNTLLLMGTAYLLVFIIGLPLALYLSQHHGTWLDKLFTFLSPLSSIPSWVHGILLIFLVAVPMKWLPISGMYDLTPPEIELGYLLVIGRHMILPVLAIVLALIFNLVYTWRTYFLIYSEEDYVELGRAKGLPNRQLHKKYVLRPGLPYVITSFALTLVSFWQTMTALEVVFNWPGIGLGYVKSLPHFFGEGMYPGELLVSIAIVVIFAYLLGIIVFLLDIIYIIVD